MGQIREWSPSGRQANTPVSYYSHKPLLSTWTLLSCFALLPFGRPIRSAPRLEWYFRFSRARPLRASMAALFLICLSFDAFTDSPFSTWLAIWLMGLDDRDPPGGGSCDSDSAFACS